MTTPAIETLADALEEAASGAAELVFHLGSETHHLPGRELLEDARRCAAALAERGLSPGDVVGILGPNHPEWARWAFSAWLAGAAVVPLPYHLRIPDAEAFAANMRALVRTAGCRFVIADPRFMPYLPEELAVSWSIDRPRQSAPRVDGPRPDDRAVIQFTSGSTAFPKGVVLTHRAVLAGVRNSSAGTGFEGDDCIQLSWLPFFHDWGLFGYLVWPIVMGIETHVLPTERFANDPAEWLRLAGKVRATMTPSPTSAWDAALRMASRKPEGIDLSSLRHCTLAAEAIDPRVVDRMLDAGARFGLSPHAPSGAYGMAETTLAVTGGSVGNPIRIDTVDRETIATAGEAVPSTGTGARRIVSCGPPVPAAEVWIVDPDGQVLPDRRVGEILARGPSLLSGYVGGDGAGDSFVDGRLRTGDLGYMADGELYVSGRLKDVIIVMGRNYAAQDIEWAAERVDGVRGGRCVAFGREGVEGEVVIAAEANGSEPQASLPHAIWEAVSDSVGLVPRDIILLPRGTIPVTTSGKLRRNWVREAYASGELHRVALIAGSGAAGGGSP